MKFECRCGNVVLDIADGNTNKAQLIPDEVWSEMFEAFDERILKRLASGRIREEAASMALRTALIKASRSMYQCCECGRMWIDDPNGQLVSFQPESDPPPYGALRSRRTT